MAVLTTPSMHELEEEGFWATKQKLNGSSRPVCVPSISLHTLMSLSRIRLYSLCPLSCSLATTRPKAIFFGGVSSKSGREEAKMGVSRLTTRHRETHTFFFAFGWPTHAHNLVVPCLSVFLSHTLHERW